MTVFTRRDRTANDLIQRDRGAPDACGHGLAQVDLEHRQSLAALARHRAETQRWRSALDQGAVRNLCVMFHRAQ
jgi:hypothetical protein